MEKIFKNKRNILIVMFALVVMMGIGFAGFSQQLQIKDTSSIDSNWDVYIKEVQVGTEEEGTKVGGVTGTGTVENKITAKLNTDLKYPGDSMTYTIIVANDGNIDAEVEKVELKAEKENTVIKYSIIDEANIQYLNAGETKSFKVKVEYDPEKTGTAKDEEKSNKLTLTVDYVQKGTGSGTYIPGGSTDDFTEIVYSRNKLTNTQLGDDTWEKENLIWPDDNLDKIIGYTKDYDTLGSNYFLKHVMNNGKVASSELCFMHNEMHCIKPNEYETNKASLLSVFGESACSNGETYFECMGGSFGISIYNNGGVRAYGDPHACDVNGNGSAGCTPYN